MNNINPNPRASVGFRNCQTAKYGMLIRVRPDRICSADLAGVWVRNRGVRGLKMGKHVTLFVCGDGGALLRGGQGTAAVWGAEI